MLSYRLNQRISENLHSLTPSEKLIGHYVSQDASPIAFLPASTVADQVGTSEATLSRFARSLAYDNYTELQRDVQEEIRSLLKNSTPQQVPDPPSHEYMDSPFAVLQQTIQYDTSNLGRTLSRIAPEIFNSAIEALARARRLYVIGFRASGGAAAYLGYLLNLVHPDVRTISQGSETAFDHLLSTTPQDVVITITLSRSTSRLAELNAYAKERGAQIVLITDAMSSARADLADFLFVTDSISTSYVQSYTAVTSLCAAIAYSVAVVDKKAAASRLEQVEHAFDEFSIVDPTIGKRSRNGGY
jgi:DNA-binding MurR/RpiR family transcriptional regulator